MALGATSLLAGVLIIFAAQVTPDIDLVIIKMIFKLQIPLLGSY
jgi:hypothetical protein